MDVLSIFFFHPVLYRSHQCTAPYCNDSIRARPYLDCQSTWSSHCRVVKAMVSSGGIITLQVGPFANFVGAHFWNLQVRALNTFGVEDPIAD